MEFYLPMTPSAALNLIKSKIESIPFKDIVSLIITGEKVEVVIKKMGTSKIEFSVKETLCRDLFSRGTLFERTKASISFFHTKHMPEVYSDIANLAKAHGGWFKN